MKRSRLVPRLLLAAAATGCALAGPGSLYTESAALSDLFRDARASRAGDLITVIVSDRASAISRGAMTSSRAGSAKYGISALAGPIKAGSRLADLASFGGERDLQGEGATSRENTLSTTVAARILTRYENGLMLISGEKSVTVNSETQVVRLKGLVRREDVLPGNLIRSDRIAELEIAVNGRGVIGDAVKRPFILYRILMGLLPF